MAVGLTIVVRDEVLSEADHIYKCTRFETRVENPREILTRNNLRRIASCVC